MIRRSVLLLSTAVLAIAGCAPQPAVTPPMPMAATTTAAPAADPRHAQWLEDLRYLASDDLQGRDTGSEGGRMAREYLVARLEAMGVQAPPMGRLQPWSRQGRSPTGPRTWSGINVLGMVQGTRATDRYIVVTAHYDHIGVHDGQIHNGADDNASGVATLLAIAAEVRRQAPEHSVLFALLDGEERGLLGARHFVEAPPFPLSSIALNLNLDMTARAETDNHLWAVGSYQNPQFRPLLEALPAQGDISLAFGKDTPQDTGADNWVQASDHGPFHTAGVPFIYLGVEFHPDYHKPTDTFERITPRVFVSSTELAISAFRALDRGVGR